MRKLLVNKLRVSLEVDNAELEVIWRVRHLAVASLGLEIMIALQRNIRLRPINGIGVRLAERVNKVFICDAWVDFSCHRPASDSGNVAFGGAELEK